MQLHFNPLELRLKEEWATSRSRAGRTAEVVIVRLTDPEGRVGWGEAAPISRYAESVDSVLAFLKQLDPARLDPGDVGASMTYLHSIRRDGAAARSAVNCALLDLAAQHAGQPLHDLLGLEFRDGHPVTSFSIGIDTPEGIRRKVAAADGFPILKIKLGVGHDREILAAVRETAPDRLLRVDANEGWTSREEALAMIEFLARDGRVEFVEQPMPADTRTDDLLWLKARSPLPLYADESFHTAADTRSCAACFHGVNVKLAKTGGISGAVEALRAARAAGLKTMLGCMVETSVGITAAAHLAELADVLDLDGHLLIGNDPFQGLDIVQGRLSLSSAPQSRGLRVAPRSPA